MKRILVSAQVIELDGEKTVLAVHHDATDQLRLENELVQSQKLEAVGRFAGSIAHDFNNILTGILAFSELAVLGLESSNPARVDVEQIQKAAKRAASLTRQLLTFARPQPLSHQTLNVNNVITDLEPMLRSLVGERSGLAITLDPDLANVRSDVTQIEQLLVNLVVNARDAMPDRGIVTIDTRSTVMPTGDPAGAPTREAVSIVVCDTGVGMPADVRDRIFEPFFTTKSGSGGTGLGLSTVYGIVKQAGGFIQVDSEVDVGTTFRIFLPATKERETIERKTPAEQVRARARVLVVDEDAVVRTVVKRILEQNGYDVTEAQSGEDALWLVRAQKLEPDLLITDIAMPVTDGGDLARKLKKELPGLCVLLMSDFSDEHPDRAARAPVASVLQKPFDSAELVRAVRAIFAEQRDH